MSTLAVPATARDLAKAFAARGHRLYLVGGTIRDSFLGRADNDIDMTTDAEPTETKRILAAACPDASVYTIGEQFGTIGTVLGDYKIEITTFRSESYQPRSRKPIVGFGTSLEEDLARRDFTINSMAYDILSEELIDPFEGRHDLERRLVRTVGVPAERFGEDPLRLLRGARFVTQLEFALDGGTRNAMSACAESITTISRERVADELNRILLVRQPSRGIRLLVETGLMGWIIPDLIALRHVNEGRRAKDVFEHTMGVLDRTPAVMAVRWSALLHDIGKPRTLVEEGGEVHFLGHERVGEQMARDILTGLRQSTELVEAVSRIVGLHMRVNQYEDDWTDGAVRRLIREAEENLDDTLALSQADVTSRRPAKVEAARRRVQRLRERCEQLQAEADAATLASPLDGTDLMRLFGRPPGPWIRGVKDYLLSLVIDGELQPDAREEAIWRAAEFLKTDPVAGQ